MISSISCCNSSSVNLVPFGTDIVSLILSLVNVSLTLTVIFLSAKLSVPFVTVPST